MAVIPAKVMLCYNSYNSKCIGWVSLLIYQYSNHQRNREALGAQMLRMGEGRMWQITRVNVGVGAPEKETEWRRGAHISNGLRRRQVGQYILAQVEREFGNCRVNWGTHKTTMYTSYNEGYCVCRAKRGCAQDRGRKAITGEAESGIISQHQRSLVGAEKQSTMGN